MRYYILITLKDNSHIEAEFNTRNEVDTFIRKYSEDMLHHATELIDRKKIAKQNSQEGLGWLVMVALGLITLFFIFK